ncbi:MAG: DUF309 domain-containing protein [Thermodesulfobacteriota bacterium]
MTPGDEELRRVVLAAAREFNAGRYFEAHEALEEALDDVPDALWPLFLGLIQVAVGYHKLAHGFAGAARMLEIGLVKLAPLPGDALGVALGALRDRAAADLAKLHAGQGDAVDLRAAPPRLLPAR